MNILCRQFWRVILALFVLCHGALAIAEERFTIGTAGEQRMWLSVSGSASIKRQKEGVLIKFDDLRFSSHRQHEDSVLVSAIRIAAGDGNTNLIHSERLPVGLTLRGTDSAVFASADEVFLQYPDWHQSKPYFRLEVEVGVDGGVVPVSTTLHELKLPSHFGDHARSPVRESHTALGWQFFVFGLLVFIVVRRFMRARYATGKEVFLAFVLFGFVWPFGWYPLLRGAESVFWTEVEAQLVDVGVKMTPPRAGTRLIQKFPREYRPVIKYVYAYKGQRFSSTQVVLGQVSGFASMDSADALQAAWDNKRRVQGKVRAWVNPLAPSEAVLSRELPVLSWSLSLAGLAALYFWARRASAREPDPDISNTLYGRLRAMQRRWW